MIKMDYFYSGSKAIKADKKAKKDPLKRIRERLVEAEKKRTSGRVSSAINMIRGTYTSTQIKISRLAEPFHCKIFFLFIV